MKRVSFVFIALVALACVPSPNGRAAPPDKVQELMRRKLVQSQKVLEGVAVQDFDLIVKHAEGLLIISKQAEWKVLKTPLYEVYSNEFRRNAEELIENAKKKNVDAAALSYVDLTLTCVKCHKHVREKRMARRD
ncbi:MAG TPA: hypothetical protein VFE78_06630 [Gemmataceae bacterium]|jgi:hypothetical protein|nr:hypothetical protein [Gemmataceae bacterium]